MYNSYVDNTGKSNGVEINSDTIVEVWKDFGDSHMNETMAKVTAAGHRAILAAPWYLNYVKYGKRALWFLT